MKKNFDVRFYLGARARLVEREMKRLLPRPGGPGGKAAEAMRHAVLAGGKRLRPILVLAGVEALGKPVRNFLPLAAAYEFLHTYSLVHDDLPAMDDDDLRRGLPTCHKKYGEAAAILAGDALHTLAFEVIASSPFPAARRTDSVLRLARAAGTEGMVGGQVLDLAWAGRRLRGADLRRLHSLKTGALIAAAAAAGAEAAGASPALVRRLEKFGRILGLAFQVVDDVLDVEGSAASLGKTPGKDREKKMFTFVDLLGVQGARDYARRLATQALGALPGKGPRYQALSALAQFVVEREH